MKNRFYFFFLLSIFLLLFSCKESSTEVVVKNSGVSGSVLFLDGSVAANATIQIQNLYNNSLEYAYSDKNGNYLFENLSAGNYRVKFKSRTYNIESYEKGITLKVGEVYTQNIFILYNMLDESKVISKNEDVFLIKFQPDGAKIGTNHSLVNYLSGTFFGDYSNSYTLGCNIYKIPDSLDWFDADTIFTANNIRSSFELITSSDDHLSNSMHEIRFLGDDITKILSNPFNGFAFVTKEIDDREIKIPCIDFNNNDFGLKIYYK